MKSDAGKYRRLGRLVELYYPDVAIKLLTAVTPLETDISKVTELLHRYRQHINRHDLTGDDQRIFICAAMWLYKPHLFVFKGTPYVGRDGLNTALGKALDMYESKISTMIRQAVVWHRSNFEGTAEKVQDFLKSVKQAA